MYAEERQQLIFELARKNGRVDVSTLAAQFDITTETVRRDLTALERRGALQRVHGGAIPVGDCAADVGLCPRVPERVAEKRRIAQAALAYVPAEGAILLDAGSTPAELADLLQVERELTVVTNAVTIAVVLSGRENITVMLVGGRVKGRSLAMVDNWALRALGDTYVDVAFLATDGISATRGLTTSDSSEAMVKRAAISAARRVIVLADHSKVGNDQFARFGDITDVDVLITDDQADPEDTNDIGRAGTEVVVV